MAKAPIDDPQEDSAEVVPARSARERIVHGIVVFGSACMAVGGIVGYALGYLEAIRQRREDREN
jgi:hypothetical protein